MGSYIERKENSKLGLIIYRSEKKLIARQIKRSLNNINWLYDINARWKANKVKKVYSNTVEHYTGKEERRGFEDLLFDRSGMRIAKLKDLDRKPNIFFLGTDEEQDRSGILQTLDRIGNLISFTRADGSYGQNNPAPRKQRRKANIQRLRELAKEYCNQGHPL